MPRTLFRGFFLASRKERVFSYETESLLATEVECSDGGNSDRLCLNGWCGCLGAVDSEIADTARDDLSALSDRTGDLLTQADELQDPMVASSAEAINDRADLDCAYFGSSTEFCREFALGRV